MIQVAELRELSRKRVNDCVESGELKAIKGKQNHNFISESDRRLYNGNQRRGEKIMTKIHHGILGFYEDAGKKVKAEMGKLEEQRWANASANARAKQNREDREANAANAEIKRQMLSGRD